VETADSGTFSKLRLVIPGKQPMLVSMGLLLWYRQTFSGPPQPSTLAGALAAAEAGDAEAQFGLGLKFSNASGATRDLDQAANWYRRAAVQGHALAQFNLGMMLASGEGVPQNASEALVWTRKAAEGGDAGAQFCLGSSFHRSSVSRAGQDCAESRIEAYKWFYLAASQGYKGSAAARERVTLTMTRDEVADGNERAAGFVARRPDEPRSKSVPPLS
jgi:TPR repeat protein